MTFDGTAKVITLPLGTTVLSVRDVYSRWVDWFIGLGNEKFLPAFLTVGGDDIDLAAGTKIPIYAFLLNGWKIKPQEADHTLQVNDGILLVNGGGDPFINTIGDFTVRVNYQQPVQAISFSSTGGGASYTLEQIADAVWANPVRELTSVAGASPADIWSYNNRSLTEAAGLTASEHDKLMGIPTAIDNADAVWSKEL